MAQVTLRGKPVQTVGNVPAVGSAAPDFSLTKADLSELTKADLAGKRVLLNIFPSVDTAVCATSVRTFNQRAAEQPGATVVCVSADLPFAQKRFCAAEGVENVQTASTFRSDFGQAFGLTLTETGMRGLLARAVIVLDEKGNVAHAELVAESAQEPDYDAAMKAL